MLPVRVEQLIGLVAPPVPAPYAYHAHDASPPRTALRSQAQEEASGAPVRDESQRLQCRFYEEQYPNPESMVMVKVMNIADMAAEVILLEYNDIEVGVLACLPLSCEAPISGIAFTSRA